MRAPFSRRQLAVRARALAASANGLRRRPRAAKLAAGALLAALLWLARDAGSSGCAQAGPAPAASSLPAFLSALSPPSLLPFCETWQDAAINGRVTRNGSNFLRAERISPAAPFRHLGFAPPQGSSDYNLSLWVYDGGDVVSGWIAKQAIWEPVETVAMLEALQKYEKTSGLRKSDIYLIDIGANIGWFAINAAAMGYSVIAFEPAPNNVFAIRLSLCGLPALQRSVTLLQNGFGEAPAHCFVVAGADNKGDGVTVCGEAPTPTDGKLVLGDFNVTTLDAFFAPALGALRGAAAVLKIDIESFEDRVFRGAAQFMAHVAPPYVICEFRARFSGNTTAEQMLELFDGWGYTAHSTWFRGPPIPREDFPKAAERAGAPVWNLFFVHRDAEVPGARRRLRGLRRAAPRAR